MNSNGSKSNQKGKNGNYQKYVGAPYNFVSLSQKVIKRDTKENNLPSHKKIQKELYSGEISYSIIPRTDIFVGGVYEKDVQGFYQAADGTCAIPGSSVRGLLRSNTQILGLGSIADDVEDYRLMYRKVTNRGNLGDYYRKNVLNVSQIKMADGKNTSICRNVKAGYITCENGKYIIYGTVVDNIDREMGKMNYYPLKETVIFKTVEDAIRKKRKNPFAFLKEDVDGSNTKLQHIGKEFWVEERKNRKNKIEYHVIGNKNPYYVPFCKEILYTIEGKYRITAVREPGTKEKEKNEKRGYILGSGAMNEKKVLYIIPEINREKKIELTQSDIQSYKIDYEVKKSGLGTTTYVKGLNEEEKKECIQKMQEFFSLPSEGQIKPVFYVHENNQTFFGYTQYLRVFYNHKIGYGLPEEHKAEDRIYDYAHRMYGFTGDKNYKGRIYIEDARLKGKAEFRKVTTILGGPKPTSYLDYLLQEKEGGVSYNDDFKIRGYKQYWFKEPEAENQKMTNENVGSTFYALKKETGIFKGKIHFKNLEKDELGLLLWTIKLEDNTEQNIGKAKPYGYGRIKMKIDSLKLYDYDTQMYCLDAFFLKPFKLVDSNRVDKYIMDYKNYIKEKSQINIEEQASVKEFLMMKNTEQMPNPDKIRYMNLKEYQSRQERLPSVEEVYQGIEQKVDLRVEINVRNQKEKDHSLKKMEENNKTVYTSSTDKKKDEPVHIIKDGTIGKVVENNGLKISIECKNIDKKKIKIELKFMSDILGVDNRVKSSKSIRVGDEVKLTYKNGKIGFGELLKK